MVLSRTFEPLDPSENRTVTGMLARQLIERPDQTAVLDPHTEWTYAQLHRASAITAGRIADSKNAPGASVALMMDNHVDYIRTWFGLNMAGMREVPVNTAYRGNILAHVLNDSGATAIVIDVNYVERIEAVKDHLVSLRTVYVRGASGALPALDGWDVHEYSVLTEGNPIGQIAELHPWDTLGILYTSGTTGPSKGVRTTQGLAYSYSSPPWISEGERIMVNLPLFHIGGQWAGVYAALIQGGSAVILPGFSASTFWDDVRKYECNQTLLLGAMASFLKAQPTNPKDREHPLRNVNMVPVVKDHKDFSERFDVTIGSAYGMTEFSSPVVTPYGSEKPSRAGWLRDDYEARIVDHNDIEVPVGTVGELTLRAREPWAMMDGYHGLPEATQKAWRNLWFHTGDSMLQNEDGSFVFVDRTKDALRVRGENVSSFEVESEIGEHPAVLSSAVVAVPSEHTEDDIKAVVVLKEGSAVEPEELLRFLVDRLPYFMVPRFFDFADELPTTPTQKIKKAELREQGLTSTIWDRQSDGWKVTRDGLAGGPAITSDATGA